MDKTAVLKLKELEIEEKAQEDEIKTEKHKPHICEFCNKHFDNMEKYYDCVIHQFRYCYACARNQDKAEIEYKETESCRFMVYEYLSRDNTHYADLLKDCIMIPKICLNPKYE